MTSHTLNEARNYEEAKGDLIPAEKRPLFHLTPRIGWMNDPNGFSIYGGVYHLFYQYYPYKPKWGPMHWGHAVSHDLLTWEHRPAVLAPDSPSDRDGCFSGSAVTLDDGRHMLMYTGVSEEEDSGENVQVQCLAFGDGNQYKKYEGNPILTSSDLPQGMSRYDFRDPKMNREEDGTFTCILCGSTEDHDGRTFLFRSTDGIKWQYAGILAANNHRFGTVWECPDFFMLDGKAVLLCSPMHMLKTEKYSCGNGNLCLIGDYDRENNKLINEQDDPIDYGIDFYATQTLLNPDGRRIMIAWMQNWDTLQNDFGYIRLYGQMTLPRELSIRNGKLYQQPIRELMQYRRDKIEYVNVHVHGKMELEGIHGRVMDMSLKIRPDDNYRRFEIRVAENKDFHTSVIYNHASHKITVDRSYSGTRKGVVHTRRFNTTEYNDEMKLRIILDRYSLELFVNDGEQTFSLTFNTVLSAEGISFQTEGEAVMDVEAYTLGLPEQQI